MTISNGYACTQRVVEVIFSFMNFRSKVTEDGPYDSLIVSIFSGLFAVASTGAVVVGIATVYDNLTKPLAPPSQIVFPACTEADRAEVKVIDMPPNVSNSDIGGQICFVRVPIEGGDRMELRYR